MNFRNAMTSLRTSVPVALAVLLFGAGNLQALNVCTAAASQDQAANRAHINGVTGPGFSDLANMAEMSARFQYSLLVSSLDPFIRLENNDCRTFPALCKKSAMDICTILPGACPRRPEPVGMTFDQARDAAHFAAQAAISNLDPLAEPQLLASIEVALANGGLHPRLRGAFAYYGLALGIGEEADRRANYYKDLVDNEQCARTIRDNFPAIAASAATSTGFSTLQSKAGIFSSFAFGPPFTAAGGSGFQLPDNVRDLEQVVDRHRADAEVALTAASTMKAAIDELFNAFVDTDLETIAQGYGLFPSTGYWYRFLWATSPLPTLRQHISDLEHELAFDVAALRDIKASLGGLGKFPAGGPDRDDFDDIQIICGGQGGFSISAMFNADGEIFPALRTLNLPRNMTEAVLRGAFMCVGRWTLDDLTQGLDELFNQNNLRAELPQTNANTSTLLPLVSSTRDGFQTKSTRAFQKLLDLEAVYLP